MEGCMSSGGVSLPTTISGSLMRTSSSELAIEEGDVMGEGLIGAEWLLREVVMSADPSPPADPLYLARSLESSFAALRIKWLIPLRASNTFARLRTFGSRIAEAVSVRLGGSVGADKKEKRTLSVRQQCGTPGSKPRPTPVNPGGRCYVKANGIPQGTASPLSRSLEVKQDIIPGHGSSLYRSSQIRRP
ncbi:hypothetical protein PR048_001514 [Dryococelus australis]|uniref:Uncharacterized protein n=1 Tax=Dryococelus australis TaxID=614101 RepID=A0ABQ9IHP4_9NEOP|nr:hypothetical protein PR048_001514 [Dryococelus australis]